MRKKTNLKLVRNKIQANNSPNIKTRSKTKREIQKQSKEKTLKVNFQDNNKSSMARENTNFDMLLLHIPTFDGRKENNINFFIKQFEDLSKDMTISETQKVTILKAKFSGPARETLINSPELYEENEYEILKQKLINEFQTKKSIEEIQTEFQNLRQKPEQTVQEFVKIFNTKAFKYIKKLGLEDKKDAQNLFDKINLQNFLTMIRQDIALEVRKKSPENLTEAIKFAKTIEAAFLATPKFDEVNTHTQAPQGAYETLMNLNVAQMDEINKLKVKLDELQIKEKKKQEQKKWCYICHTASHSTEICFYNSRATTQNIHNRFGQEKKMQEQQISSNSQYFQPYASNHSNTQQNSQNDYYRYTDLNPGINHSSQRNQNYYPRQNYQYYGAASHNQGQQKKRGENKRDYYNKKN